MKILITTSGSRGDVQPLLALAAALKAAGHQVVLAGPPENRAWANRCGCAFAAFGGRFDTVLDRLNAAHTAGAAVSFLRFIRRDIGLQFNRMPDLIQGIDLVLAASLSFATASFAEQRKLPYGFIGFCPQVLPSTNHPPPTVPITGLTPAFNRLCWRMDRLFDQLLIRPHINRHRRGMNLPPVCATLPYMLGKHVVLAADAVLAAAPQDTPALVRQTGSLTLASRLPLPDAVKGFLNAGPPPVYIGFGSMPQKDIARLLPALVKMSRSIGHRLFISVGPATPSWSDTAIYVHSGELSHPCLFEKMAVIVHHGGAGTTATAARSGIPQILIPHVLDQFFWAGRIDALALGPKPIWRIGFSVGKLQKAIMQVIDTKAYHFRAQQIASHLKAGDSLRDTVDAIEAIPTTA